MHQLRAGRNRLGAVGGQASAAASPGDRPARGGPCGREEEPDLVDSQPALPPYRRVRPPAATVAAWIRRASARRAGRARGRLRYGSRPTTSTGITAATGGRGRLAGAEQPGCEQRPRASTASPIDCSPLRTIRRPDRLLQTGWRSAGTRGSSGPSAMRTPAGSNPTMRTVVWLGATLSTASLTASDTRLPRRMLRKRVGSAMC